LDHIKLANDLKKTAQFQPDQHLFKLSKTLSCTKAHFVDPDASKSPLKADTTLYLVPVFHEKLRKAFKLIMPQSMDL
jgi:hypothetical protein